MSEKYNEVIPLVAIALFFTALIGSVPLSVKVHSFEFLGNALIPAGTILFSLCYLATDILSEISERKTVLRVIFLGVFMRAFLIAFTFLALRLDQIPGIENAGFWTQDNENAFNFIMQSSQLVLLAGIVAFAFSSTVDVLVFHYFKSIHSQKNLLWFRNNISTIIAQLVGTVLFVIIAFGTRMNVSDLLPLILGQFLVKTLISIFDTPLVYLGRNIYYGRPLRDFSG